jgi:hypothetical protein
MNYTITNEWQSLQTIMGDDYDAEKQYRLHNNVEQPSKLAMTEVENPTSDTIGRIYPAYCDIYVDAGLNPKVRVTYTLGVQFGYNIEVTEVATEEEQNNGGEE